MTLAPDSTDLADRLRFWARVGSGGGIAIDALLTEAAAEIERLRTVKERT